MESRPRYSSRRPSCSRRLWIAVRTDLASGPGQGDGTRGNPFDGSTATKFDGLLNVDQPLTNKIGANTLVHVGPGIFRTKGRNFRKLTGWQLQNGQVFRGAGMYQTVIRLQLDAGDYGNNSLYTTVYAF